MFESRDRVSEDQQEFWVETRRLPKATASTFYRKLDDTLNDIGFTKHGACDMVYKPEHITDLESGAIVMATVRQGYEGDTVDLPSRVISTSEVLGSICDDPDQEKVLRSLTADEGYFGVDEVCCLQEGKVRVVIGDPHAARRNTRKQGKVIRSVLNKARRAVRSKSGKALLRKRGEHLERSFCHVLDHGGLRRATLRGEENLTKRQLGAALTYNLSLLMRHLTGTGTPKQWLAGVGRLLAGIFGRFRAFITIWRAKVELLDRTMNHWFSKSLEKRKSHKKLIQVKLSRFSTGC